jgi:hypothetical protein
VKFDLRCFRPILGSSRLYAAVVSVFLTLAAAAEPQTVKATQLPETMNICLTTGGPGALACKATERHDNKFNALPREGEEEFVVERFDANNVVLQLHGPGAASMTLTG